MQMLLLQDIVIRVRFRSIGLDSDDKQSVQFCFLAKFQRE